MNLLLKTLRKKKWKKIWNYFRRRKIPIWGVVVLKSKQNSTIQIVWSVFVVFPVISIQFATVLDVMPPFISIAMVWRKSQVKVLSIVISARLWTRKKSVWLRKILFLSNISSKLVFFVVYTTYQLKKSIREIMVTYTVSISGA